MSVVPDSPVEGEEPKPPTEHEGEEPKPPTEHEGEEPKPPTEGEHKKPVVDLDAATKKSFLKQHRTEVILAVVGILVAIYFFMKSRSNSSSSSTAQLPLNTSLAPGANNSAGGFFGGGSVGSPGAPGAPGPAGAPAATPTVSSSNPVASGGLTAPGLPSNIASAMIKNGEHIVSQTYDAASNTWLYATNKGGVYTLNPSGQAGGQFYGSYLGLPAQDQQGNPNRQFSSISATPNGGYTLTSTGGHTYNFGPGAGQYNSQTQVKPLPGPQNFTSGGTAKGWGIP